MPGNKIDYTLITLHLEERDYANSERKVCNLDQSVLTSLKELIGTVDNGL